jgi:hypothetical protein
MTPKATKYANGSKTKNIFPITPNRRIAIKKVHWQRTATRYHRFARNYLASVCLAAALVWWTQ